MDVLVINAALWNLSREEDIVASAATVIEYGKTLRHEGLISIEGNITSGGKSDITGDTGYGNVTVSDDNRRTRDFSIGSYKDRVGHFRVWREAKDCIWFSHFWKSELDTAGDEPEVEMYRIKYDLTTLQLVHFGKKREERLFSLWGFQVLAAVIEPIWGSGREIECITLSFGNG